MTQSQILVADAIEASRTIEGFFINVTEGNLDVGGDFDEPCLTIWRRAMDACVQEGEIEIACIDADDEAIGVERLSDGVTSRPVRFLIKLPHCDGAAHILAVEQLRSLLLQPISLASVSVMRVAGLESSFASEAFSFLPWTEFAQAAPIRSPRSEASPRRFVKCLAPQTIAPSEIEPWIEKSDAHSPSRQYEVWKEIASSALCRSLTNEIFVDGETMQCILASTPSRRLPYGQERNPSDEEFNDLQTCARWVYLEGTDIEVRHTLFTNELGREWRDGRAYLDGLWPRLRTSLDAAKLAYKAHLKAGSKETLKSLADLRKTLGDEIQKLMQQTRDLSANVWRDIAVALGVTAIRFGLDPTKISGAKAGFAVIFTLSATYIWMSYWITLKTNREFLQVIDNTRAAWRDKLYGYLDSADYQSLAEDPMRDATSAYNRTKARTTFAVTVIVLALFGLAIWESEVLAKGSPTPDKWIVNETPRPKQPQSMIESEKSKSDKAPLEAPKPRPHSDEKRQGH